MPAFGEQLRTDVEALSVVLFKDVVLFSYAQLAVLKAWFVCRGLFDDFPGEFPFELFFGIYAEVIFNTFDFPYVSR